MMNDDDILDAPEKKRGKKLKTQKDAKEFRTSLIHFSREQVEKGVDKTLIFKEAINLHGNRYRRIISRIVGFSVTIAQKKKYQNIIHVLTLLQILIIIFTAKFLYDFYLSSAYSLIMFISFVLGAMFWEFTALKGLIQNEYEILSSIVRIGLLKVCYMLLTDLLVNYYWTQFYLILIILMIILSFYVIKKNFPTLGIFGFKKDALGDYRF